MDSVLWKRYHGKLEHRVVDLHETLPLPRRLSLPPTLVVRPMGSSSTTESGPTLNVPFVYCSSLLTF